MRQDFDASITTHLGPAATAADFPAEDLTPDPCHYDDDDFLDPDIGDVEVTPEAGDNLVSAEIMLPRGGTMARGCVLG